MLVRLDFLVRIISDLCIYVLRMENVFLTICCCQKGLKVSVLVAVISSWVRNVFPSFFEGKVVKGYWGLGY